VAARRKRTPAAKRARSDSAVDRSFVILP
jgi:hypothetical protein